jgi:hypothetical protein
MKSGMQASVFGQRIAQNLRSKLNAIWDRLQPVASNQDMRTNTLLPDPGQRLL